APALRGLFGAAQKRLDLAFFGGFEQSHGRIGLSGYGFEGAAVVVPIVHRHEASPPFRFLWLPRVRRVAMFKSVGRGKSGPLVRGRARASWWTLLLLSFYTFPQIVANIGAGRARFLVGLPSRSRCRGPVPVRVRAPRALPHGAGRRILSWLP